MGQAEERLKATVAAVGGGAAAAAAAAGVGRDGGSSMGGDGGGSGSSCSGDNCPRPLEAAGKAALWTGAARHGCETAAEATEAKYAIPVAAGVAAFVGLGCRRHHHLAVQP